MGFALYIIIGVLVYFALMFTVAVIKGRSCRTYTRDRLFFREMVWSVLLWPLVLVHVALSVVGQLTHFIGIEL